MRKGDVRGSYLEMTQGRMPAAAISMIFSRMWLGSGRPLMNTPPSWLTRPWPGGAGHKAVWLGMVESEMVWYGMVGVGMVW